MQIIDLADHILAVKNQHHQNINQFQLNDLTLRTLNWINNNYLSYKIFDDYNQIAYRFKNQYNVIPSIHEKYKFYVALAILDIPKPNRQLNAMPDLNAFIINQSLT